MNDLGHAIKNAKHRYIAIPLLLVLASSLTAAVLVPAIASADSPANLQVKATNSQVRSFGSEYLQVQVQQGTPSSSYSVTVQVVVPAGAGGPYCETVTITTDGSGNGWATVDFPGTFLASECSPAGTGGPTAILPGTYTVTVSSVPAITAGTTSTAFAVEASPNVVAGTGTLETHAAPSVYSFIQAPGSTTASPLYVSCTGTTTSPTITTAPYYSTNVASVGLTGVITTNTPGQFESNNIRNPCNPSSASTFVSTNTNFYVFDNVTITLPDGRTATGGLRVTQNFGSTNFVVSSGVTSSTGQAQLTLTGTGGLRGVTGLGVYAGTGTISGTTVIVNSVYWVQLTFPSYGQ